MFGGFFCLEMFFNLKSPLVLQDDLRFRSDVTSMCKVDLTGLYDTNSNNTKASLEVSDVLLSLETLNVKSKHIQSYRLENIYTETLFYCL